MICTAIVSQAPLILTLPLNVTFFSPDTIVDVQGKGCVPINQIQVGDSVLATPEGEYSPVDALAHKTMSITFPSNETTSLEIPLKHLIWANQAMVPARSATFSVMDSLLSRYPQSRGAHAPLTEAGTVMVGKDSLVMASSYVTLSELAELAPGISMHWASHMAMTPLRLLCHFSETSCLVMS